MKPGRDDQAFLAMPWRLESARGPHLIPWVIGLPAAVNSGAAAAIREGHVMSERATAAAASSTESPVVIESTARRIEPMAVLFVVLAVVAWAAGLSVLPRVALAYAVIVTLLSLVAARGRLTIGPDGLTARYLFRTIRVPWTDVWALSVEPGFMHRYVRLRGLHGRSLALPALRGPAFTRSKAFLEGVDLLERWSVSLHPSNVWVGRPARFRTVAYTTCLVLSLLSFVAFDQPWYWMTRREVAQLPEPCAVVVKWAGRSLALSSTSAPAADLNGAQQIRSCTWSDSSHSLVLTYRNFKRHGLMSGTGVAAAFVTSIDSSGLHWRPDHHISHNDVLMGDEAFLESTGSAAKLVIRWENVVVIVTDDPRVDGLARIYMVGLGNAALDSLSA
jgi:PH (Pleckstrin Homology) domain-containing protein